MNAKKNAIAFEAADHDELHKPGAYRFTAYEGRRVGIRFGCPCGCGQIGLVYFKGKGFDGPEWDVSGEWPKATLSPSIGFYGSNNPRTQGHHWHGFLRAGVFESC